MISQRAKNYPPSTIRCLTQFAITAESQGVKVVSLNLGAPDLPTPELIKEAGIRFLKEAEALRYGPSGGDPKLIRELVKYYYERLNIKDVEAPNLMITQGASEALELVMYTVADPGDTILVPDPCYANYGAIAYKYGVNLSPIPTNLGNAFHLIDKGENIEETVERLAKYVTSKTKAILWSSPCNPTGTVYSNDELRVLLALSKKYNLYLIADEVYRLLAFANTAKSPIPRSPSILDFAGKKEREKIVVLDSASKMLSFCGGRVGIVTASPEIISSMTNQASVRGCPNTISQAAVSDINTVSDDYFSSSLNELKSRRDYLHHGLLGLKKIGVTVSEEAPEGAFYLVADLGEGIIASDYCQWLLTDYVTEHHAVETVFLTPMRMGNGGFYLEESIGDAQVRIAYVLEKPFLAQAISIIEKSLPIYKKIRKDLL